MVLQVAVFVLLGIILAGAALGYWIVRRFVISKEDGTVDAGVAQFVKWAMRIIGVTFILQVCIYVIREYEVQWLLSDTHPVIYDKFC